MCVESSHCSGAWEVLVKDCRGADQAGATKVDGVCVGQEVVKVAHDDADKFQEPSVDGAMLLIII